MAKTNRTPFDFAEGESVSGFNVEHGDGRVTLIFSAEYVSIPFRDHCCVFL